MVSYLAWSERRDDQTEPPQVVELAVFESIRGMGLEMPPVRKGWFGGTHRGGQFCDEQFPGSFAVWYWQA